MKQRHLEATKYADYLNDAQLEKESALRTKDESVIRQTDNLNRNFSKALESQRRDYEEIF